MVVERYSTHVLVYPLFHLATCVINGSGLFSVKSDPIEMNIFMKLRKKIFKILINSYFGDDRIC